MICTRCVGDLAENIGYALRSPFEATIAEKNNEIDKLTELLDAIPNQTEGLINAIRASVTDFVFAVSDSGNSNVDTPIQDAVENNGADDEGNKPADVSAEAPIESAFVKRPNGVPTTAGSKRTAATNK
jgi:hypothetical protein